MKKTIFGITWNAAQNIYWLPALIVTFGIVWYLWKKRTKSVAQLVSLRWVKTLLKNYSPNRSKVKSCLMITSYLFIFLALLAPQWGQKEKLVEQEGRELFIALDISRSMLASDVKPNRLAFSKSKIQQLLRLLPSERVGLVVFSGTAVVQCPLTRDKALFNMFLNHLDAETISSGTTAIDHVIAKIVGIFAKLPARKNKILVVFTDGEDFSRNLAQVRQEAQKIGLHIFTYGVGTAQGAPIPVVNDQGIPIGYEKNDQGNVVLSRLNEGILKSLSQQTGGKYISPTQSSKDLYALVEDVKRYEKEKFEDKDLSTEQDRYPYFLGVTLVCLLLEWLL